MAGCSSREATERRRSRKSAPTASGLAIVGSSPWRTLRERSRYIHTGGRSWRKVSRLGALGVASEQATPASRPNVVLMFPDNLGWGEVNVYGGVRGAITPRLDRHGGRGSPAQQLQRRVLLHGLARGADDRTLRHPHRRDAGRRHDAVGSDDRGGAAVDRLRHGPLRQVASRRRPRRSIGTRRNRASTSTTASRAPATRRRRRSRRARPRRTRRSSGRAGPDRRRATSSRSTCRRAAPSIANRPTKRSRSWSAASATGSRSSSTTR